MGVVAAEAERGRASIVRFICFGENTYDLQANNCSVTFSLPFLIVALNEGCINNRSDAVCSSVETFQ